MALQRFFQVEKIYKPAQIKALDGVRKRNGLTFPVNILDVIQKAELACRTENVNYLSPSLYTKKTRYQSTYDRSQQQRVQTRSSGKYPLKSHNHEPKNSYSS